MARLPLPALRGPEPVAALVAMWEGPMAMAGLGLTGTVAHAGLVPSSAQWLEATVSILRGPFQTHWCSQRAPVLAGAAGLAAVAPAVATTL